MSAKMCTQPLPIQFNIYTELIFRENQYLQGIRINGKNKNNLRYADDTGLMAENTEDLQALTTNVKANSEKSGHDMNVKKNRCFYSEKPTRKQMLL